MSAFLTAAAFIVLIAAAAYVIHRLNIEHADRIAEHRYSAALPGHRRRGTLPPREPGRSQSPASGERRDHRDGGRGRFPPRRRRSPTTRHT
ncbi:hypothetical protein [Streptomyces sp. NPDC048481]|uniref:hypothetical protein n=1 Tax=Streptomyces sp. NPDC048481 TaxID=3365557 RepID=UPI00372273CD